MRKKIYKISSITLIVFIFITYLLSDYVRFGGSIEFIKNWQYWCGIIINLALTIMIMLTTRDLFKNKLIDNNAELQRNLDFIQRSRRIIIGNAFSSKLDEFLVAVNNDNKVQAFRRSIEKQINDVNNNPLTNFQYKEAKIKKLEELLNLPNDDILKRVVKYKKVTKSALFTGIDGRIISVDDYDILTHETTDVFNMIFHKSLGIFLFSAFGTSLIVDFMFGGVSAIYSTLIKAISLLMSMVTAIQQAEDFVNYNIAEAMNKRVEILSNFVNKDEELKNKIISLKSVDNK